VARAPSRPDARGLDPAVAAWFEAAWFEAAWPRRRGRMHGGLDPAVAAWVQAAWFEAAW